MKNITGLLHLFSSIFPRLSLWSRFPGIVCWAAVSMGIITVNFIPTESLKILLSLDQFYIIKIISAMFSFFIAIFFPSRKIRFITFFLLSLLFCTLRSTEHHCILSLLEKAQTLRGSHTISGNIISSPVPVKQGYRFLVKCKTASFDQTDKLKGKIIQCTGKVSPVSCADVLVYGHCRAPRKALRSWEFNESQVLLSKGIWAKMTVDSISILSSPNPLRKIAEQFRERVFTVLYRLQNPAHRAILQASFLGESDYLTDDIKEIFRKSGIYHLLAISGLHASMLIAATYIFLALFPVNRNVKHVVALAVLWLYQLFIGFIPSLFRATIMATLIIGSFLYQKKNYSLQSIGLAGTLWLLHSPESLFLPGFQLSFAATIGIITIPPVLNCLTPKVESEIADYVLSRILSAFNISLSGFLSTLPILIFHFGSISIFGLLANLIAVSIMTLNMWSFFISLFFEAIVPFVSSGCIKISALMMELLIWISRLADRVPWSIVQMDKPYTEMIFGYLFFLISLISIDKKYTISYIKWCLPILLFLFPAISLLKTNYDKIYLERFSSKNCAVVAVCWPHRGVWVLSNDSGYEYKMLYKYSVQAWMRHLRNVREEKILFFNNTSSVEITELFPKTSKKNIKSSSRTALVNPIANPEQAISLFTSFKCSSKDIIFRIETKTQKINFCFSDSTISYSMLNESAHHITSFPSTFSLSVP